MRDKVSKGTQTDTGRWTTRFKLRLDDFMDMNKEQLINFARSRGCYVSSRSTKKDIANSILNQEQMHALSYY